MACAHCEPYSSHFVLRGHCSVRWRGKSFDGDQALGNVGLALMQVLGYPASGFLEFSKRVKVTPFRETGGATSADPLERLREARIAGTAPPDREGGEWWDFHVAIREPVDPATLGRLKEVGRRALDRSRNFSGARIVEADGASPAPGSRSTS